MQLKGLVMGCELLTAEELGKRLRLTTETVRRWAREGMIPAIRISPRVVRFDPVDVEVALRQTAESKANRPTEVPEPAAREGLAEGQP